MENKKQIPSTGSINLLTNFSHPRLELTKQMQQKDTTTQPTTLCRMANV